MPLIRKFKDYFKSRNHDVISHDEKTLEELSNSIDEYYINLIDDSDYYDKEIVKAKIFTHGPSLWLTFAFRIDEKEWYSMPGIKKEEWSKKMSIIAGRSYSKLLSDYKNLDSSVMTDTSSSIFKLRVAITIKHEGDN